jgi:hypothetical protein
MLNSLQNLPHEYLRKKTRFSPIVVQMTDANELDTNRPNNSSGTKNSMAEDPVPSFSNL